MISLILYGRNDSYGYNLHKRAAISLNCMAEMLTSPDDEIIFVDYNTPDDFPTFPEAIQDTLTTQAKKLLRILRVRPSQHAPFRHLTSLVALEPIARNVAVRRSNPANRWVLSTNTDMVFVPQRGAALSDVVATLPDAYYPLPRFEVPETLWESADRLDPKATIEAFGAWGRAFHLNEIVLGADPTVKYDAPGDFQLVLRSDLWEMHGFHEGMLLGWHVDSNLAKRLSLIPRSAGEILDDVFGYHCDHTRQVTPAHRPRAAENDLQTFFEEVTIAQIPEQADTWGLAGEVIEEINVNATSRLYLEALRSVTPTPLSGMVPRIQYAYEHHNRIDYAVEHVLPFVADAVASYRRDTVIGWFGCKRTLLERFAQAWRAMGFSKEIMVPDRAHWLGPLPAGCVWAPALTVIESSDVFLFDWGRRDGVSEDEWSFRTDEAAKETLRALRLAVRAERRRLAEGTGPARRFIGVNAVCNDAEQTFHELVGAARTPIATRLRQGYVSELLPHMDLLPALNAGGAARKVSGVIVSRPGVSGCIFYLSHLLLDGGAYQLHLEFDVAGEAEPVPGNSGVGLSVTTNSCLIGNRPITEAEERVGAMTLDFVIPHGIGDADDLPETEFQMRTLGRAEITIRRAMLAKSTDSHADTDLTDFDFFSLLTVGPGGTYGPAPEPAQQHDRNLRAAVRSVPGVADFLVYGPHVWLLPGRYEATFEFWAPASSERRGIEARIEIVSSFGAQIHAEQFVDFSELGSTPGETWRRMRCVLGFDVRTEAPTELDGLLEFRVWSEGADFSLVAVDVHRVGDPNPAQSGVERLFGGRLDSRREAIARQVRRAHLDNLAPPDVLWLAQVGPAGRRVPGAIEALPGVIGLVTHGPYIWLLPGHYEISFNLFGVETASVADDIGLEVVIEFGNRILAADVVPGRAGLQKCSLFFDITSDAPPVESGLLEFRIWSPGTIAFRLSAVRIREVDVSRANAKDASRHAIAPLFGGRLNPILATVARQVRLAYIEGAQPPDVLRRLQVGTAGRRTENAIEAAAGESGVLAHGPYLWLLPGRYEVTFEIFAKRVASGSHVKLEVVTELGNRVLAERFVEPHWYGRRFERALGRRAGVVRFALPFEISKDIPEREGLLEFRVWSPGTIPFKLTGVFVRQVDSL